MGIEVESFTIFHLNSYSRQSRPPKFPQPSKKVSQFFFSQQFFFSIFFSPKNLSHRRADMQASAQVIPSPPI